MKERTGESPCQRGSRQGAAAPVLSVSARQGTLCRGTVPRPTPGAGSLPRPPRWRLPLPAPPASDARVRLGEGAGGPLTPRHGHTPSRPPFALPVSLHVGPQKPACLGLADTLGEAAPVVRSAWAPLLGGARTVPPSLARPFDRVDGKEQLWCCGRLRGRCLGFCPAACVEGCQPSRGRARWSSVHRAFFPCRGLRGTPGGLPRAPSTCFPERQRVRVGGGVRRSARAGSDTGNLGPPPGPLGLKGGLSAWPGPRSCGVVWQDAGARTLQAPGPAPPTSLPRPQPNPRPRPPSLILRTLGRPHAPLPSAPTGRGPWPSSGRPKGQRDRTGRRGASPPKGSSRRGCGAPGHVPHGNLRLLTLLRCRGRVRLAVGQEGKAFLSAEERWLSPADPRKKCGPGRGAVPTGSLRR